MKRIIGISILATVVGCNGKDRSDGTGLQETSGESGMESGESGLYAVEEEVFEGVSLCASGGKQGNDRFSGVSCTAPMDIATQPSSNSNWTWQPGAIRRIAPGPSSDR